MTSEKDNDEIQATEEIQEMIETVSDTFIFFKLHFLKIVS